MFESQGRFCACMSFTYVSFTSNITNISHRSTASARYIIKYRVQRESDETVKSREPLCCQASTTTKASKFSKTDPNLDFFEIQSIVDYRSKLNYRLKLSCVFSFKSEKNRLINKYSVDSFSQNISKWFYVSDDDCVSTTPG